MTPLLITNWNTVQYRLGLHTEIFVNDKTQRTEGGKLAALAMEIVEITREVTAKERPSYMDIQVYKEKMAMHYVDGVIACLGMLNVVDDIYSKIAIDAHKPSLKTSNLDIASRLDQLTALGAVYPKLAPKDARKRLTPIVSAMMNSFIWGYEFYGPTGATPLILIQKVYARLNELERKHSHADQLRAKLIDIINGDRKSVNKAPITVIDSRMVD